MNTNEIWIYDEIGRGESTTTAVAIQQERADQTKPLVVRINSDGGLVFQGYGIFNTLVRHKAGVIVEIDGIAASAASLIAMAGNTIRIADGAFLMIHQCWGGIFGNKEEMPKFYEETMARMENIDATMIKKYAQKSGLAAEDVDAMLRAETWLTSEKAVEMKFADEIMNEARAIPFVEQDKWEYKNTPAALLVPSSIAAQYRRTPAAHVAGPIRDAIEQNARKDHIERLDRSMKLDRKRLGV